MSETAHAWKMRHGRLLGRIDDWFSGVRQKHSGQMQCGRGCALCCYGLFDVTFPDALVVAEGLDSLSEDVRTGVKARAAVVQQLIMREAPGLTHPYLLRHANEARIDSIADSAKGSRCPFLGERSECLIYKHRPMACRLEGVPMLDAQDGLFGDWCELNFIGGVSAEATRDLQLDYYGIQAAQESFTRELTRELIGRALSRATVFIPSIVVEFEPFWKDLLPAIRRQGRTRSQALGMQAETTPDLRPPVKGTD